MILLTTTEAAQLAHARPENVRDWARRGLLVPVDRDQRQRPLYRAADVLHVERATRANPRHRQRATGRQARILTALRDTHRGCDLTTSQDHLTVLATEDVCPQPGQRAGLPHLNGRPS